LLTATLTLEVTPRLEQRASPELLAYAGLLALPTVELESVVEREVEQNPALERLESPACQLCGEPGPACACGSRRRRTAGTEVGGVGGVDVHVADELTPAEAMFAELAPIVAASDRPILSYLLGSLDARGFIDAPVDEMASRLGVSRARVRAVLGVLRHHGPAGVGASNLRECLLLQLDRLEERGADARLPRLIVDRHLELLAAGRLGAVAAALGASRAEVADAAEFIRTRLRPSATFDPPRFQRAAPPAMPDVVIRERADAPGEFAVDILERRRVKLVVAPSYAEAACASGLAPAQRERVGAQIVQARVFLDRLERRWETMRAVAEFVVARQRDYLARGPRHMKRLTRAQVAAGVGFHESTVSRAINGRYVLLPRGRVAPFAHFFEAARGPRTILAQLIAEERTPLTDAVLADELTRLGFPLARRTVTKYREHLGIPRHTER
jgi:RNA polymerase sigma-54 factor